MTLYLKYRPQLIDELDLASVRESLTNIVKSGNIPHSFLFSGPKGTGKTSAARILAKIINCESASPADQPMRLEPCNTCDSCISITKGNNIDVIELDAASNRGIDDIRSLKEGIYLAPARAIKKVYIIDEAHMLTLEAANAFLKTLEEPPDHVVFILATTNPEKLPATVISRLARVDFTKANDEDIARQLSRVAKGEKIKIEDAALKKISKLADGSFRDAVKILENLSFKTHDIKEVDIEESSESINKFFEILTKKDTKEILEFIENMVKNGINMRTFTDEILGAVHTSLLAKNNIGIDNLSEFSISNLINLINLIDLSKKQISPIPQLPLEIAIVKFCSKNAEPVGAIHESPATPKTSLKVTKSLDDATWLTLLKNIREKNVSIEALLRAAKAINYDGKTLTIGVYYQFHKDKLEDTKNKNIMEKICEETFGNEGMKVIFELIEKPVTPKKETPVVNEVEPLKSNADKDIIDAAKEIFG